MQSFRQKNLKKEKNCCQDLLFRECLLSVRNVLSSHNGNKTKIKSQLSLSPISREMRLEEAIGPCCYLQKIPVFSSDSTSYTSQSAGRTQRGNVYFASQVYNTVCTRHTLFMRYTSNDQQQQICCQTWNLSKKDSRPRFLGPNP